MLQVARPMRVDPGQAAGIAGFAGGYISMGIQQQAYKAMVLTTEHSWTIASAIRQSAITFEQHDLGYGHGTDCAEDEASWLILHALGLPPELAPDYEKVLTADDVARCNEVLGLRINERLPAAYITGKAWFAGLSFRSDKRALVPRSPLAEFIRNDFFGLLDEQQPARVLDLCTGGGCIAIACATALPDAHVDGSDLSAEALSLAAENVAEHGLQSRVQLLQGSLFDNVAGPYDLIISNPPYVDAQDIHDMADEFRHEPLMGLAAGLDGLDLVRQMLPAAAAQLNENGMLVVEVGNSAAALEAAYPDVPFLWLEFEGGGSGVFVLTRAELLQHAAALQTGIKSDWSQ